MSNRVLAIGHRGAAGHQPENTMPSFEKALELGADALEFDVVLTLDGVPIVIHDDTLDRTTNGCGAIEQALYADLQSLDAGSWKGTATHVPTLAEVLAEYAPRTLLNLEIKTSPRRGELVEACVEAVLQHEASNSVVFSSFDHDALRVLRTIMPTARIGVLCGMGTLEQGFACALELGAENLHPPALLVTEALVQRAHAANLQVWTWTANATDHISRLLAAGVDGIFSDWPERVVLLRN